MLYKFFFTIVTKKTGLCLSKNYVLDYFKIFSFLEGLRRLTAYTQHLLAYTLTYLLTIEKKREKIPEIFAVLKSIKEYQISFLKKKKRVFFEVFI